MLPVDFKTEDSNMQYAFQHNKNNLWGWNVSHEVRWPSSL